MLEKILIFFDKIYKEKPKKIKKRGRPKIYTNKQLTMMYIIMRFKNINSYNGIVQFLLDNKRISNIIGLVTVPNRTTIIRRSKYIKIKLRRIIISFGIYYCKHIARIYFIAAVDSSIFKAIGPLWHRKDRKLGIIPFGLKNVDKESKWGYSPTKGWQQGYKGHFNVIFDNNNELPPFPFDAVVTTANIADITKCKTLGSYLHDKIVVQLADKGYNDNDLFKILYEKGILFITPLKINQKLDGLSLFRYFFYLLTCKYRLYGKRNTTIEPFNGRIKDLFTSGSLPVKGKTESAIFILSSVICYQLMILHNLKSHKKLGAVKRILNLM